MSENNLFGNIENDEVEVEERIPNRGYKINTDREFVKRKRTVKETIVEGSSSLFADLEESVEKPSLDELYISQDIVRDEIAGTNGLKSISLFTGGGGSMTGFAWAGYKDVLSVEFVKAARESLQANYESFIVEPEIIAEKAIHVAKEMGIPVYEAKEAQGIKESHPEDLDALHGVILTRQIVRKGKKYQPVIDWAMTMAHLNAEEGKKFRYDTNKLAFEHYGEQAGFPIFGDDVRGLDPNAVLEYTGIKKGELDVLEGSPPCKSFSTSGLRERGWGEILHYSGERDQTTDDLFLEFLRILDGFRPRAFIAENVSGMLQGSSREKVLKPLLAAFREIGYNVDVREFLISNYGVAQARPRIIFMGIRDDQLNKRTGKPMSPSWPEFFGHSYTVGEAIEHAQRMSPEEHASQLKDVDISDTSIGRAWRELEEGTSPDNTYYQLYRCHRNDTAPTITSTSAGQRAAAGPTHPFECRKFTIPEYRALFGFPYDYKLVGDIEQQGERLGRCVPPFFMKQIAETLANILNRAESTKEQLSFDERSESEQVSKLEDFTFISTEEDDE